MMNVWSSWEEAITGKSCWIHPTLQDARIAKNYLKEDELKVLNNLVSGYFDFAEIQAMRHNPMYMLDYVKQLDNILSSTGGALLTDAGKVSHAQAMKKAEEEYRKYEVRTLSPVEAAYLDTIKKLGNETKRKKMEWILLIKWMQEAVPKRLFLWRHGLLAFYQRNYNNSGLGEASASIIAIQTDL